MRRLVPALALVLLACGDRLVGASYPGDPLATLSGRMMPTPETEVTGPVRLALAWYPQWLAAEDPSAGSASALSIVTEDVEVQGTFPVDFRFPVYRPPPREALAPLAEGLAGSGAFGILLAYEDGDGDRRLDRIAADGAPVDRVVASSLLGDPAAAFALVYVDSPQAEGTGLRRGFNLVQGVNDASAGVVPLDTRLDLSLTSGGPLYDAFVCEAGWLTFLVSDVCGLPAGGEDQGLPGFAIDGRVALDGTRLQIELTVTSLGATHPDANVNVNGRVIPYDAGRGTFYLEEEGSTLVRPGSSFVASATAQATSVGAVFTMPGDLAVEAPAEWQTVSRQAGLDLRWAASAGATSYYAGYDAPPAGESMWADAGARSLAFQVPAYAGLGQASAFVEARVDPEDGQRFITTALVRRRSFYLAE